MQNTHWSRLRLALDVGLAAIIVVGGAWAYRASRATLPPAPTQAAPELPNPLSEDGQIVVVLKYDGIRAESPQAAAGWVLCMDGRLVDIRGHPHRDSDTFRIEPIDPNEPIIVRISVEDHRVNRMSDLHSAVKMVKKALPMGHKCLIEFYM